MAAIQLEKIIQQPIPKLLLAAVQVMEKAQGKRNPPGGWGLYIVDDGRRYRFLFESFRRVGTHQR